MNNYNDQQIVDWIIARNRADLRLNESTKPFTKLDLESLLEIASGIYLNLFGKTLLTTSVSNILEQVDLNELKGQVTEKRALNLATNFDSVLSNNTDVFQALRIAWNFMGSLRYNTDEL